MAGTRRLFIGLAPSLELAEAVHVAARDCFAPHDPARPRFSHAADIHLTLLFLGDVDEQRIPALESGLEVAASEVAPLIVEVEGMGAFPSSAHPRTLWAGVRASEPLDALRAAVVHAARASGLDLPAREAEGPYRPHLTLARLRSAPAGEALASFLALEFRARWRADEIVLFQSGVAPGVGAGMSASGPALRYRQLGRFRLATDA